MCVFVWALSSVLMDDSSSIFVGACSQSSGSRLCSLRCSFYVYRKTLMWASEVDPHKTPWLTDDFNPCGLAELSRCDVLTSASDPRADMRTSLRAHQVAACGCRLTVAQIYSLCVFRIKRKKGSCKLLDSYHICM